MLSTQLSIGRRFTVLDQGSSQEVAIIVGDANLLAAPQVPAGQILTFVDQGSNAGVNVLVLDAGLLTTPDIADGRWLTFDDQDSNGEISVLVAEPPTLFAGTMSRVSRTGSGITLPEYKNLLGPGYLDPPEKWSIDQKFELTLNRGITTSVVWCDERHLGTHAFPASGPATLVGDHLTATLTYGAYQIAIDVTLAGSSCSGTITTTVRSTVAVHTIPSATGTSTLVFTPGLYYSAYGNDLNTGESLIASKLTPPVATEGLVAYDERGSIFTAGIASINQLLEVTAVGEGHCPVTNQFDVISTWTDAGSGAWSCIVHGSAPVDPLTPAKPNAIEDGRLLTRVQNLAAVQATPGSIAFVGGFSTSGSDSTVYIHTTDGSDPNTNGKIYEVAVREMAFCGQGSSKFIGQIGRGNTSNLVLGTKPRDVTDNADLTGSVGWFGNKHNISFFGGKLFCSGSVFVQADDWDLGCAHIVAARQGNDASPATFDLQDFFMIGTPGVAVFGEGGLLLEIQTGTTPLGNVTIAKPYAAYVSGSTVVSYAATEAAAITLQAVDDALFERISGNSGVFASGKFAPSRLRHYQLTSTYWGHPSLSDTTLTEFVLRDSLCVVGTPNPDTGAGYLPIGSGPTSSADVQVDLRRNTFQRVAIASNDTPLISTHGANSSFLLSENCIGDGFGLTATVNGSANVRIPGDNNSIGTEVNPGPSESFGFWTIGVTYHDFADWQDGSAAGWSASDAASVAAAVTFSGTTTRYPSYVKTSAGPGGYAGTFIDVSQYAGIQFIQALEAIGQMPA